MQHQQSARDRDTRRLVWILLIVGIGFAISTLVFVTEYSLLLAEMSLIEQKLELKIANQVGDGSVFGYITSIVLWIGLLGVAISFIWGRVLFPSLDRIEKFMASLAIGVFVMPLSFVIPAFIVSLRKLFSDYLGFPLPDYYGETVTNIVVLFGSNHEQAYELFNILLFLLLGVVVYAIKVVMDRRTAAAVGANSTHYSSE